MKKTHFGKCCGVVLALAGIMAAGPVFAEKPDWAGGGNKGKQERKDDAKGSKATQRDHQERPSRDRDGRDGGTHRYFGDRQRVIISDYYDSQIRSGRCPPGLAKKNNGCMPPGQARKWAMGAPLPRDVIYYELPSTVIVRLGPPPSGHRYVRVASDILLIAVGTGMVVDAIEDLGRM